MLGPFTADVPQHDELADSSRVCTYDRAGLGWSEPGPEPRTGEQIVEELEALLEASGESGPYVLAGHSLGGLTMLMFAEANPDQVDGVVLIDSSHPRQDAASADFPGIVALREAQAVTVEAMATRAEAGVIGAADILPLAPPLPLELKYQWAALAVQPHSLRTVVAESNAFAQTLSQVSVQGSLGDIPLIVLAAGLGLDAGVPAGAYELENQGLTPKDIEAYDSIWGSLQQDHVNRSTNGRLVVAENSGHSIHLQEPDVVLQAIGDLTGRG